MEVKKVKCPNCGAVLSVKNSKNEALKLITCPKCKASLRVKFKQQNPQEPLEAHTYLGISPKSSTGGETQYGPSPISGGETQLGGYQNNGETQLGGAKGFCETQLPPKNDARIKTAYLRVGGRDYPLQIGVNIVGRKASTSTATVQIETPDRYMSRQHAKIVVTRQPGGKLKAVISNDHNKNISTIDGQDLLQGDAFVLNDGDHIIMGETTVIYKEL